MGKIIIVESSTDGCGKETQTKKLFERLEKEGKKVTRFTFPNYESYSSIFVKKYLNGEYGKDPKKQDPYIISTFFAIDRYITFKEQIEKYYNDDYYIIIDRYVISNMIYASSSAILYASFKNPRSCSCISFSSFPSILFFLFFISF